LVSFGQFCFVLTSRLGQLYSVFDIWSVLNSFNSFHAVKIEELLNITFLQFCSVLFRSYKWAGAVIFSIWYLVSFEQFQPISCSEDWSTTKYYIWSVLVSFASFLQVEWDSYIQYLIFGQFWTVLSHFMQWRLNNY